jgi:alkanesulfonate monooxygenase SsuD/methylene tetrahydromethanopterin reductase-like flavin-dependent oxidoreductase (luciferase family)
VALVQTPPDVPALAPGLPRRTLFGISVTPTAADHAAIVRQVAAAERGGLDLVGIQDHPYQRRFLDTFALIADLAARTERISFFPDVASLPMRGPTMIAKAAASIDVMSGGRFELGIGAGAFWDAVAGMGGPRRSARESFDALEESLPVIRAALDAERSVRASGPHVTVSYPPGPPPAHRVEIWIGAYGPRGMRLIGEHADGWVPSMGRANPERLRDGVARMEEAAAAVGRDPRLIRRVLNVGGSVTDGEHGEGVVSGPVALWVETLAGWAADLGADAFVFWPPDAGTDQVERFVGEVVPAVRAALSE